MDLRRVRGHEPTTIADEERDAAVVVPIIHRTDGDYLLFIKRADHLGEHPGQMSFPGGGHEPSDADLRATAIREAGEEVGLRPDEIEFVGRLDDTRTTSRYAITPFVAEVPDREYAHDEREVSEIVVLPLAELTNPDNYEAARREHPQFGEMLVHFFHVEEYTVWGATGRILVQFLELALEWTPPEGGEYVVDPEAEFPPVDGP
ncbi:MAG: CoA pyrophosphatase [Halanaeroarchaeum sp.]